MRSEVGGDLGVVVVHCVLKRGLAILREGERGERAQVTCGENSGSQRAGVIYIMDRVKEERPAEGEESRCEKERGTV